ncbi:MAG TPA: ATP-binding SpoIIE family protein phosphatase [Candidatus Elarobacter sp.]
MIEHAVAAATAIFGAEAAAVVVQHPGSIDVLPAAADAGIFVSAQFGERGRSSGYLGMVLTGGARDRFGEAERNRLAALAIAVGAALDRTRTSAELARRAERDGYLAKLDALLGTVGQTEMLDSVLALQPITLSVPGLTFDEFYEPGPHAPYIGGDWYDAFRVRDGRVVLSIGDVPGVGLRAASTMASVRQVIRGVASVNPEPRVILEAVERILEGGASHDAPFVTAWVGVLDPVDLTLSYASAGHPAPLWRNASNVVRTLPNGDPPLGIGVRSARQLHTVQLEAGSALLLYTDGLIEADRDVIRGERAVKEAFVRLDGAAGAHTMRDMILAGRRAHDDIALLYVGIDHPIGPADGLKTWTIDARNALEGHRLRREFAEQLKVLGYGDAARFQAELAFGELLGNVVRHAPGATEVRLDPTCGEAVVHVLDGGCGFHHNAKLPEEAYAEGGRGLFLVGTMVDDLVVGPRPEGGAHVRAVLRRHPADLSMLAGAAEHRQATG